ncbi:MAG TPA: hypothetical protein DDW50_18950 [Firmicutes bacterium]|jgi:uncharacterized protein|nr:hypothetical protein [Bacillota bacterium]
MKKALLGIAFLLFLILSVSAKGPNPKDFQFYDKNIGIALRFPDEWEIFTDEKKAPDFFKAPLKNRKSKNDPVFFGMKKSQTAYTKLTVEKYEASLDVYVKLFELMLNNSNIKVSSETYSEDKKNVTVTYYSKVNNIPVQFVDYIVVNNGYALRLSFWSLDSMFNDQRNEFTGIAHDALFYIKPDKNNWVPLWANVNISNAPQAPVVENNSKYMFFTVKGKTNTVYLMGSIHIGKNSFYPFPERIEKAFSNTNNIVVEFNPNSKENAGKVRNISSYGYLEDNKTLKDVLSKDLYKALETNLSNYNIPIDKMARLKPWLVASSLVTLKMMSLGYVADSGTEKYFLGKANDKKIFELESFEEQTKVLDSIDGNLFLTMTLLSLSSMEKDMDGLIESWKNQDMRKFEEIAMEGIGNINQTDYFNKIYFNRNIAMTEKIKSYLGQDENYFVIVGSEHLVGEKGILALLKKAGYTVE